ncbi:DUF4434 domain-containing protein [Clostridium sp. Mt-5]|uniref:DUF4434 domain-containing protein n=1 Tax=Clostridium moutaii TaxID=3240932 RepID=A0ABV4BR57_9CLOT
MISKFFYRLINCYDEVKKKYFPQVSGTFIQPDMVMNWNDLKWQRELFYLKEVKMKYIVMNTFIVQNQNIRRIYKTSIKDESEIGSYDVVDMCLRNCEKAGFKVFLGIDYNSMWWKIGPRKPEWLYNQMKKGNLVVQELYEKYHEKYKNAFYGWYWVYEVDNLNFKNRRDFKILANAVNINLNYMDNNSTRLPLMISPFMNSKYSIPQTHANNWKHFFKLVNLKKGDIFCPQDSVGGGGLDITEVKDWFNALNKAVKSKKGILFWANVETFDHTDWSSAPIKRFINQMRFENPFVDDMITFAYSHYYSPNNINSGFHRAYKRYLYQHEIYNKKPDVPQWIKINKVNNKTLIQWEIAKNAAGYKLYCNGKEIYSPSVQRKYGGNKEQSLGEFICRNSSKKSKYEIETVDFWGNVSRKITVKKNGDVSS